MWDGSGGGHLKLSVNEWPDGDHPSSAAGSMPASPVVWPLWRFFAVTYDANAPRGSDNVAWYFGNSEDAATLDTRAAFGAYQRGAVSDPNLPLSFGNFGSFFHANDRMLRGGLFHPQVCARLACACMESAHTLSPPRVVAGLRPRSLGRRGGGGARSRWMQAFLRRQHLRARWMRRLVRRVQRRPCVRLPWERPAHL